MKNVSKQHIVICIGIVIVMSVSVFIGFQICGQIKQRNAEKAKTEEIKNEVEKKEKEEAKIKEYIALKNEEIESLESDFENGDRENKLSVFRTSLEKLDEYKEKEDAYEEITTLYETATKDMQEYFIYEYETTIEDNTFQELNNIEDRGQLIQAKAELEEVSKHIKKEKDIVCGEEMAAAYEQTIKSLIVLYDERIASIEQKEKEMQEAKKAGEERKARLAEEVQYVLKGVDLRSYDRGQIFILLCDGVLGFSEDTSKLNIRCRTEYEKAVELYGMWAENGYDLEAKHFYSSQVEQPPTYNDDLPCYEYVHPELCNEIGYVIETGEAGWCTPGDGTGPGYYCPTHLNP